AGALRGFVAEIEDIVAEALLPVLRHGGGAAQEDHALAALWGAGVVGHVRSVAERWIAARSLTPEGAADSRAVTADGAPAVEGGIATLDRAALAAHITDWLWTGAMGVARRSRNASTRTETDDAIGDPS